MAGGKLTRLQERILGVLAPLSPPWTLTGGAALAAVDAQHRETRDLDLFWRERRDLGDSVRDAAAALQAAGRGPAGGRASDLTPVRGVAGG